MKNSMSSRIFFKLLPVQMMIIAMGSINSIIDGIVAGRFIDSTTVGVIGLFSVALGVINAIGSVILGGSNVLSGRYMGSGDMEKTRGIFSLTISISVLFGIFATAMGFLFTGTVADICRADASLKGALETYIVGFSIGIIPQILSQQLAAFLQLERQSKRNYIGIAAMIVSNIVLDISLVAIFNMGVFGLALSTALCNWIYFLVLVSYYFTGKAQLRFEFKGILWEKTFELVKIGFPGALLVFCLAFRDIVINRLVLTYAGQDGLSAKSSLGMVGALFICLCIGTGAVNRMLTSVHVGEEDKDSIKELMKLCFTKVIVLSLILTVVVIATSGPVIRLFFADTSSNVYKLSFQYFMMFGISIPLIMVVQILTNYLQAMGHNLCVNVFSVIDGFVSVVAPSLILAPIFGIFGIFVATPVGIVISALVYPVYAIIFWKRIPRNKDEWLLFKKGFGVEDSDRLIFRIREKSDVADTAEKVQSFCMEKGFAKKTSMYCALCLEEMTRNVVEHGFTHDKKEHYLDARIVKKDDEVILRIKDDCISFDPVSMSQQLNPEDKTRNIGIRMVMKLAKEANYQSLLGLNVMTIKL